MKFDRPRFAVIPTRNRPEVLMECLTAIRLQVDEVIVINNGDAPLHQLRHSIIEHRDPEQPVNLSRLWNKGLDLAAGRAQAMLGKDVVGPRKWDVAILNDDAVPPPGWFDAVSDRIRSMKVAAGCSGPVTMPVLHTKPGPVNLHTRMQGWAFILAGEVGIRANEDLRWWFGDDDLDWQSRKAGGMVMIPGYPVEHKLPNGSMTPELHVQTGIDAQQFKELWGMMPW